MKFFLKKLNLFFQNLLSDSRIPQYDKKLIGIFLLLILSPIDFIPDWIPLVGLLDDFLMLALIFDYFFKTLDHQIILSHYPWDMKSFNRLQRVGYLLAFFAPSFIKNFLWKYKKDIFS